MLMGLAACTLVLTAVFSSVNSMYASSYFLVLFTYLVKFTVMVVDRYEVVPLLSEVAVVTVLVTLSSTN